MADRAVRRKARGLVIRIVGVVVIRHVTRGTGGAAQGVVPVHVTLRAWDGGMRAG